MFDKIKKPGKPKIPKVPKVPKAPKIPKIEKGKMSGFLNFLNKNKFMILVLFLVLICLVFINIMIKEIPVLVISIILYISVVAFIILKSISEKNKKKRGEEIRNKPIKEIILIDEDGVEATKWEIEGVPSLVIGKNGEKEFVDIDLSETVYSNLISREHAVMNHDGTTWFVEDIGSMNGTGVKSSLTGSVTKLLEGTRFPVYSGDVIYIANTTLLLK